MIFTKNRKTPSNRVLAGDVAYLETLLRAAVSAEPCLVHPTGMRLQSTGSERLALAARRFIDASPALRHYAAQERPSPGVIEITNPWVVLSLAKADLDRRRASRGVFTSLLGGSSKAAGIYSLVFTAICGIAVAAVTSYLNTQSEIKARWAEEVYSGRRQFLQETITKLLNVQVEAQNLRRNLIIAESGGRLSPSSASFHLNSLGDLKSELRRITAVQQADPESDFRFAQLRAYFELEALDGCLKQAIDPSEVGKSRLAERIRETAGSAISVKQAEEILAGARVEVPCGGNFQPKVFEDLAYRIAGNLWNLQLHLEE